MTQWCLPWWHAQLMQYQADKRPATSCPARTSADATYPAAGFVPCSPESLRQAASKAVGMSVSLNEYALARNIHSERGSGSVEEWVVIGEVARNEAWRRKISVAQLLLLNRYKINAFGTLDQGRWASTKQDPTVGEILVAKFILSGRTGNFAQGATSYIDPDSMGGESRLISWITDRFSSGRWAWVGQLPGVPVRRTFAMRPVTSLSSQEMLDNQQGLAESQVAQQPASTLRDVLSPRLQNQ